MTTWAEEVQNDLAGWVGRSEVKVDVFEPERAIALLRALGDETHLMQGDELPSLFHWLYFWNAQSPLATGPDGHPKSNGILPPHPLPRRMWAGGRLTFLSPILVGDRVERHSEVTAIKARSGQTGKLVFITVTHRLSVQGRLHVLEEQDIVFRAASTGTPLGASLTVSEPPEPNATWHRQVTPDPVLLFRYSALTMNSHRIHYDEAYTREVEHYPGLVVQGPLQATLLAQLCSINDRRLSQFNFRGLAPALEGSALHICGEADVEGAQLWIEQNGTTSMSAEARWTEN